MEAQGDNRLLSKQNLAQALDEKFTEFRADEKCGTVTICTVFLDAFGSIAGIDHKSTTSFILPLRGEAKTNAVEKTAVEMSQTIQKKAPWAEKFQVKFLHKTFPDQTRDVPTEADLTCRTL